MKHSTNDGGAARNYRAETALFALFLAVTGVLPVRLLQAQTVLPFADQPHGSGNAPEAFSSVPPLPSGSGDGPIQTVTRASADLPDAPGVSVSSPEFAGRGPEYPAAIGIAIHVSPIAPLYHKYIEPGQAARPLASADKVLFGFHQLMSPYLLLTIASAAGYEQAVNGSPNYGTNFGAYGQRLGAGAIRDASQTIFSDSIMAPILHEDPRYYVMGNRRNGVVRAAYAVSRVFVTRTDDEAATPNYSLLSGYAGAAALENAYYPGDNRGFSETAKSYGGSIGGAALSNVVREFLPDILRTVHLEK